MSADETGQVNGHLDASVVAAFVEGRLGGDARHRAADHLAECETCREEVVGVTAALTSHRTHPAWRHPGILLAAAAALLLAVVTTLPQDDEPATPSGTDRNGGGQAIGLAAISPAADGFLDPTASGMAATFIWHAHEPGTRFHFTLVDEQGVTVYSVDTGDSAVSLPTTFTLASNRSYYWYVDALGADGRSLTTGARRFTVR